MAILGSFSLGGALDKILTTGDIEAPAVQSALKKLTDNPKAAMEKVLNVIASGPRLHHSTAYKLVSRLLDNTTVGMVMQALPSFPDDAQAQIATTLNTSNQYDPHLLLPYLRTPLNTSLCKDMLTAHRRDFKAAKLLSAVIKIDPDLQDNVFELIHANVDETALAEAIALSHSKDDNIRTQVTSIIAEFDNPAAQEALMTLLNDNSQKVRLNALRGLVKIRADLATGDLFRLMSKAKKEESPLVKALISCSTDPKLLENFIEALFAPKGKMKPLAIAGLSELMNKDVLYEIFYELHDKPEATQDSMIRSLQDAGGEKFLTAANELLSHYDEDIRRLAANAFHEQDTGEETVIEGMLNGLAVDIPNNLKLEYIEKLGHAGVTSAVDPLIKILGSEDTELFAPSLDALASIGDPKALAAAFEALNAKDIEIQTSALKCLNAITPDKFAERLRDQLLELSNHVHEDVIEELVNTVETLTDKHNLRTTTHYKRTIESLKKSDNDEFGFAPEASSANSMFAPEEESSSSYSMFGKDEADNGVFGVVDETDSGSGDESAEPAEEPVFAVNLEEGLVLNDRYELIREIGRGGYGSVWLIKDNFIQEEMVMKFLHQQLVSDDIAIERFIRELRLARKITHKNIIRLFDYLDLGKVTAISMEYFEGAALSSLIKDGPIEINAIAKIASITCDALHSAHEAGVIHRDMKPANILVDTNHEIKIVDFGIAAASKHAESRLTRTGTLIGTPTYISPEQIQGKAVDARTDIYSLGIIMYEMLSGSPPYLADDPMALIFMHVEGSARRIDDVNPLVPKEFADIVHKCILPDPDERFQSMLELREAISQTGLA